MVINNNHKIRKYDKKQHCLLCAHFTRERHNSLHFLLSCRFLFCRKVPCLSTNLFTRFLPWRLPCWPQPPMLHLSDFYETLHVELATRRIKSERREFIFVRGLWTLPIGRLLHISKRRGTAGKTEGWRYCTSFIGRDRIYLGFNGCKMGRV